MKVSFIIMLIDDRINTLTNPIIETTKTTKIYTFDKSKLTLHAHIIQSKSKSLNMKLRK